MRRAGLALLLGLSSGCDLQERPDFMVGRACDPAAPACDPGEACLPHALIDAIPTDFRCRDASSLQDFGGEAAPLAYCLPERGIVCPEGTVCQAGRIRTDSGPRARICRLEDGFGPPPDDES